MDEDNELVKYMSTLPSFLERGVNSQDRSFSVGVLNWGQLEKWQRIHKEKPQRSSSRGLYGNNDPSFSAEKTSGCSSSGERHSPVHQRIYQPTLQSSQIASPRQAHPQFVKFSEENVKKSEVCGHHTSKGQHKVQGEDQSVKHISKRKEKANIERMKHLETVKIGELPFCLNDPRALQESESTRRVDNSKMQKNDIVSWEISERPDAAAPLPSEAHQNDHDMSQLPDSPSTSCQVKGSSAQSLIEKCKDAWHLLSKNLSHDLQVRQLSSLDAEDVFSSDASHSASQTAKVSDIPRQSNSKLDSPTSERVKTNNSSMLFNLAPTAVSSRRLRSSSPLRRSIVARKNKGGKSSSSKEQLRTPLLSSNQSSKHAVESTCSTGGLETSAKNTATRLRSSSQTRSVDPIPTAHAASHHHAEDSMQKISISQHCLCRSSRMQSDSHAHRTKVKLGFTACKNVNISHSHIDKRQGMSVQAILRVAFKNGLPLLTFSVNNDNNVLAATKRKCSYSRKGDPRWVYTFFTIPEVKRRKAGCANRGRDSQDCMPDIVAKLNVSNVYEMKFSRKKSVDQLKTREFILLAVDSRPAHYESSDHQPNDELAAIVLQIPLGSNKDLAVDAHQSSMLNKSLTGNSKEDFGDDRGSVKDQPTFRSEGQPRMTVILPNGVHSLPRKGEPSSLIQRWKSGGACDCGGWDLGCQLRILANDNTLGKAHCPSMDRFSLFSQVDGVENQLVFSITSLKHGNFSVEFSSTLSKLQALSIGIAVLESRNLRGTNVPDIAR